jgi:alpha-mannosidase II
LYSSSVFHTKEFPSGDFVLHARNNLSAKFSGDTGLLKAVTVGSNEVTLDLEFVSYGTRSGRDKSGAYLFLPNGDASSISKKKLKVITIAGPLVSNMRVVWARYTEHTGGVFCLFVFPKFPW